MKNFYILILVLLTGAAYGQSNLPACQGSDVSSWSNCSGSETLNGNKYVGEFKVGKYNGQGTVIGSNGDKYVGEFKDGLIHGQGTVTTSNGNKYVGWFKQNKMHGQGTLTGPKDVKYVGEFKEGSMHGRGTLTSENGDKYVGEFKNGLMHGQGTATGSNGDKYVGEFQDNNYNGRGIKYSSAGSIEESGIYKDGTLVTSQYIDPNSFTRIARNNSAPAVSDSQRQAIEQRERQVEIEAQRVAEERRRLEEDKRQRELAKQSSRISITASSTQPDSNGVVTINIQTNTDTSSLKINGEELGGKVDGSYSVKRVARVGQETKFVLAATDVYGNTDSKTITVVRQAVDSKAVFGQLNAANVKQQPARDAVAIIIGIERYKRVTKADFANADAQDFYDYSIRALGIKPENIKLLVDEGADDVEIYKAFQNWLPVKVKKGKTDVYVFYSGHGYPAQDGNSLYILPYGADKDLISKTAINQQEIVSAIQNAQPRNVTMFLDSCYSGQTRGGDVLIAGARPIAPKISSSSYPPNFTVISASSNDQISSASPDLKHGIFSYFLMKGMEGDADLNRDGAITVSEMHEYLTDMVGRQAMSMNRNQQPQLLGVTERVLVAK
jgi:hypothetical protein